MRLSLYIFLLVLACNTIRCIQIPEEAHEKLQALGHVTIHTYKQPFNEQNPQIDGGFILYAEQIEQLGSPAIVADIEFTDIIETETGYSRPPIELHYIDKKTFQTILDLQRTYPNLPSNILSFTLLPTLLFALDYLLLNMDLALGLLRDYTQNYYIAQLYRDFNQSPRIFDLLQRTIQLKSAWKPSASLLGHMGEISAITISYNGQIIVSGSTDGTVNVWQLTEQENWEHSLLIGHTERVNAVTIDANRQIILSGSSDHTVRIWHKNHNNTWEPDEPSQITLPDKVTALACTLDLQTSVFGLADHTVVVWTPDQVEILSGQNAPISSVSITADGNYIGAGAKDGSVSHWKKQRLDNIVAWNLKQRTSFLPPHYYDPEIRLTIISADGDYQINSSYNSCEVKKRNFLFHFMHEQTLSGHNKYVTSLAMTPNGKFIVSGSADSTLCIYQRSLVTGQYFSMDCVPGHTDEITSVAISADASRIVSGSKDGTIKVWELESVEDFCERLIPGEEEQIPSQNLTIEPKKTPKCCTIL